MANRAKIVLNVIEILEELKGDIAEKREFLKIYKLHGKKDKCCRNSNGLYKGKQINS
ncbi:hypothetical protein [uncultured Ilyobacter sp.]|uniref:hypothetical protein n=1 Tax=uncultured Ilyobacter sp. TaxID=544433 RepID=UPI0029C7A6E6|nr:hypothetical protein [uncultured Ilyobacter sp.]